MTPKTVNLFFAMFLLFIIFFSFGTDLPQVRKGGFLSDESTYYAIIQSLAHDGDLKYTRDDIVRIKKVFWVGPMGLFLKKGKNGQLYYAKSFIYPLAAVPFFRLFGVHGILLANGLMILLALLMGYLLLRQYHPVGKSFAFTLVFLFSSVTFIYSWWITADLFNFFVNFAGPVLLFLCFQEAALGRPGRRVLRRGGFLQAQQHPAYRLLVPAPPVPQGVEALPAPGPDQPAGRRRPGRLLLRPDRVVQLPGRRAQVVLRRFPLRARRASPSPAASG